MIEDKLMPAKPQEDSQARSKRPEAVNDVELKYMNSRSAAVLETTTLNSRVFLWTMVLTIAVAIIWADNAMIDEVVKGSGKIVPSNQIKSIQNLEGGIVKEILVREGATVKAGEALLKMQDIFFSSTVEKNRLNFNELYARSMRLRAEAYGKPFVFPKSSDDEQKKSIEKEHSLYLSNKKQLSKSVGIVKAQLQQHKNELKEAQEHFKELEKEMKLVQRQININKPLVERRIVSEIDYIKLQREQNSVQQELTKTKHAVLTTKSMIEASNNKLAETTLAFQNRAKVQLNSIEAEMQRIQESQMTLKDQVSRTLVRSPVNGIIKKLYVNTIGGVVTPGMNMMDILPTGDSLLVEVQVHPRDIAFLYPSQKAVIKVTAYEFAIYGGLVGYVVRISPDSINDVGGNTYYKVWIETEKTSLGTIENPLNLMPGMVVSSDIVTGKKSILDYILKPLLRTKDNAFKER